MGERLPRGAWRMRAERAEAALREIAEYQEGWGELADDAMQRIARAALSDTEDSERQRTPGEERAERFYG
jgi:hypothetical protein